MAVPPTQVSVDEPTAARPLIIRMTIKSQARLLMQFGFITICHLRLNDQDQIPFRLWGLLPPAPDDSGWRHVPQSGRRVLQACQRVGDVHTETICRSSVHTLGPVGHLPGRGRNRSLAGGENHTNRHLVIGGNSSELEKIRSILTAVAGTRI